MAENGLMHRLIAKMAIVLANPMLYCANPVEVAANPRLC